VLGTISNSGMSGIKLQLLIVSNNKNMLEPTEENISLTFSDSAVGVVS